MKDKTAFPTGMTLHEYYVGQILAGMYANPGIVDNPNYSMASWLATEAIRAADVLMENLPTITEVQ